MNTDLKARQIVEGIVDKKINVASFVDDLLIIFRNHIEQKDERTWKCSSGWVAAAFLASYRLGQKHPLYNLTNGQPLLFRGHADSSWKLKPYLFREGIDRKWFEKATKVFTCIVSDWFRNLEEQQFQSYSITNTPNVIRSIAQHYGIPTSLLDWTPSPMIALNFATSSNLNAEEACIFALPLSDAFKFPLSITIPPSIVERIYLQQGVFIDLTEEIVEELERISIRVLFPSQPEISPIGSEAMNSEELLKKSNWFEAYANTLKELEKQNQINLSEEELYLKLLFSNIQPNVEDAFMIVNEFYLVGSLIDFTQSLGFYEEGLQEQLQKDIAMKLKTDNPLLFDALADSYKSALKEGKFVDSRIEKLIALSEVSI